MLKLHKRAAITSIVCGATYGVMARALFELNPKSSQAITGAFGAMTVAFLFGVPLALGAVTVATMNTERRTIGRALLLPWIAVLLCLGSVMLLAWEGIICIAIAMPVFLFLSSLGGLLTWAILRGRDWPKSIGATFALLPFIAAPVEHRVAPIIQHRIVRTSIEIAAPPDVVWKNIAEVPHITVSERPLRPSAYIGIPDPIEARLDAKRVGGTRLAKFDRGIEFREVVTLWEPEKTLAFVIHANTNEIKPNALDRHVLVGGEYFDVLDGRFDLERTGRGTRLNLRSTHRLSTHFNTYAGFWSDWIMRDVQNNLLKIIAARCERGGTV